MRRKPSCLTSCSHCPPAGGRGALDGRQGSMKPVERGRRRRLISERTKAALAAKKAQGASLDNPKNLAAAGSIGLPIVQALQSSGATTLDALTRRLNERGVPPCSRRALAGLVGGQLALANEAARRSSLGFVNRLHRREFSGRRGFFKDYPNKGAQYSEPYGCPVPPAPPGSALCRTQVRVTQPCRNIRSRRSSVRGEAAVDRQADADHEARGRAA